MMRDYSVHYKGNLVGIFRDFDEAGAIAQAKMKVGSASLYSSADNADFIAMKVGLL